MSRRIRARSQHAFYPAAPSYGKRRSVRSAALNSAALRRLLLLSALNLVTTPPAALWAEEGRPVVYLTNAPSADQLAKQALDCLKRGEDAENDSDRRAAYEEGLRYAKQALALNDNHADAHFAHFATNGRLLLLDGTTPNPFNLLEVNRELDRVLELKPDHPDALAAKGGIYRQLPRLLGGSDEKAEEFLKRSISLEPDDALGARLELAQLYRDQGAPERGVPLVQRAIAIAERDGRRRKKQEAGELLEQLTGTIQQEK